MLKTPSYMSVSFVEMRRSQDFGAGRPREARRRGLNLPVVGSISRRGTTEREGTSDRVEIGLRESGRLEAKEVKA